jgi:hypothetical protein
MRIAITILLIASIASGCAFAKKTYTSDGKEGYLITCSGSTSNWGKCYEKAGNLCKAKGYEILEKNEDKGVVLSGSEQGVHVAPVFNRSMIIQCKKN